MTGFEGVGWVKRSLGFLSFWCLVILSILSVSDPLKAETIGDFDRVESHCDQCHSRVIMEEHKGRAGSDGKPMGCLTCHGDNVSKRVLDAVVSRKTNCDACHTVSNHESKHSPSGLDSKCQQCHKALLTDEHLRNTGTQSAAKTCQSCHSSPRGVVRRTINSEDTYCWSCHQKGHGMGIEDKNPGDIPLMPGFQWAPPSEAAIWAGEEWLPREYNNGQILFTNRNGQIEISEVATYYGSQLLSKGWHQLAEVKGTNLYRGEFASGNRKLLVWAYTGAGHDAQETGSMGCRVELIYTSLAK